MKSQTWEIYPPSPFLPLPGSCFSCLSVRGGGGGGVSVLLSDTPAHTVSQVCFCIRLGRNVPNMWFGQKCTQHLVPVGGERCFNPRSTAHLPF